jgi:hypothetical protein
MKRRKRRASNMVKRKRKKETFLKQIFFILGKIVFDFHCLQDKKNSSISAVKCIFENFAIKNFQITDCKNATLNVILMFFDVQFSTEM